MSLTPQQKADFGPHVAIDINDLSGWRGARESVLQREFQADHDEAKMDQDWGEQEYVEGNKA